MRRFYSQFIQPDDLVYDVGAHVGSRTRVFASLGRQVVAIEPQPRFNAFLQNTFSSNPKVILEPSALGAEEGEANLLVSQRTPTVTSLSDEWVSQVRQDGSFAWVEWDKQLTVPVTTLDALIEKHGLPAFCKIDVEGYELQVLQGLSQPIAALSFEYVQPTMQSSLACIDRLESLGQYGYNLTVGEGLQFVSDTWMEAVEMQTYLKALPAKYASGDIYARLVENV